ncbi:PIG-L family deacetylase [Actinoplanes sp. KI2]|uniref:PIG-L family deacetylase n=1 Tax=Actinoplanes sp. KI2 TaxID=2983315 RepID=UPI0021D5E168|nr:PIG-L family deacetylase [Actinoplanes sp. KI2]MCU7728411.1 PIG-L family deacetylase [Actinoplanes sp. KI2]
MAHEDDDLLFLNPSVSDDVAAGRCVVTVFVTAGDSGRPYSYWEGRESGSMAAYATAAGLPGDWTHDTAVAAGHAITRYWLHNSKIQLLFMRLPDAHGNPYGRPVYGLERLWNGQLPALRTVDLRDTYTKKTLVATLTALMNYYRPDEIRTLDFVGHYGDGDHNDHHTVGYLTYAAQRAYALPHRITGYMGYPVENQPANLADAVRDTKLGIFLAYAPYDNKVCQTYDECMTNFYAPRFDHSIVTGEQTYSARPRRTTSTGNRP